METELIRWIKKYVSGKYNDFEFEAAIDDVDLFFDLTEDMPDSVEMLLTEISGAVDCTPHLKSCIDIEKLMKTLAGLLFPAMMNEQPEPLFPNDNNRQWMLANLYKQAFRVVPFDMNLKRSAGELIDAEPYRKYSGYLYHYLVTYCLRNKITHNSYEYTMDNENAMISSYLVALLDLCHRYHTELAELHRSRHLSEVFSASAYMKQIISDYDRNVKQGFGYIDMCWFDPERPRDGERNAEKLADMDCSSGLKLIGIAGTGKSTVLRRIEYILAKRYTSKKSRQIPIYIELADITEDENILLEKLSLTLGISEDDVTALLNRGGVTLLLDGYNEVLDTNIKRKLAKELDSFLRGKNNVNLILSDRSKKCSVPTLQNALAMYLKPITNEERRSYFNANCGDERSLSLILERMENDPEYFIPLDTPLKLKQLTIVAKERGELPDSVTEAYIECLFDREQYEKKDENMEYLPMFLQSLALLDDEDIRIPVALNQMAKCKNAMGYSIPDTQKCLNLAVDMGVLVRGEDNTVSFATDDYKPYFFFNAVNSGLDELIGE